MRNIDWNQVQEAGARPTPGGYLAWITRCEDVEAKEYLKMEWEFCDPKWKGTNEDTYNKYGFWPMPIFRSYKEKAMPKFKGFKTAVEKSNPGYIFRNDPPSLAGRIIGVILGEEEYRNGKGEIKKRMTVTDVRSAQAIQAGDFEVPPLKKLEESGAAYTASPASPASPAAPAYTPPDFAVLQNDETTLPF